MPIDPDNKPAEPELTQEQIDRGTEALKKATGGMKGVREDEELLLRMDAKVASAIAVFDGLIEKITSLVPDRQPAPASTSCNEKQAVLKISTALKAVHLGAVKMIYKVLPMQIKNWLQKEVQKIIEKVGIKAAGKAAGKKIGLGALINVPINVAAAIDFANATEQGVHDVLGCKPNKMDGEPMRFDIGQIVKGIKERTSGKAAPMGKVSTRKPKK